MTAIPPTTAAAIMKKMFEADDDDDDEEEEHAQTRKRPRFAPLGPDFVSLKDFELPQELKNIACRPCPCDSGHR